MEYWSKPPIARSQIVLFSPTLDSCIAQDHPIRLFDEVLSGLDWSEWESHYFGCVGQPPIQPKIIAGVILYGLSIGIRPSRVLERVCSDSISFIWFTSGRSIDHSTICKFRIKFSKELKKLFRQIGRIAMKMGLIRLNEVGLDGTRVKANNGRHKTACAKTIKEKLESLDKQIEQMFSEAQAADNRDSDLYGSTSANHLPKELSNLEKRKESLEKALASTEKIERKRSRRSDVPDRAAGVPLTDTDSLVLPNKEGGYAPNYTPITAVDGHRGFIVDACVDNEGYESHTTVATVDRIEQTFDKKPEKLLADSAHGTGSNYKELAERGVETYIPAMNQVNDTADNPAKRADPQKPVDESDWDKLPRNPNSKKLDRTAFVYDTAKDCYYCPMGREMKYFSSDNQKRKCGVVNCRSYMCRSCENCPLSGQCLGGKSGRRRVVHDEFEKYRQEAVKRIRSPEGKEIYQHRSWICESPNGIIKTRMKLRQFLLRGIEKVETEWFWACTSFNISKLISEVARIRADFAMISA
jgi:transposase